MIEDEIREHETCCFRCAESSINTMGTKVENSLICNKNGKYVMPQNYCIRFCVWEVK